MTRAQDTHFSLTTTVDLAPGPEAVGLARRAVTEVADGHVDKDCLDTLRLLVSELVTNSIRHADTRESLELSLSMNRDVLVAVTDRGAGFIPLRRTGDQEDVGGWGLYLVDELSSRWGVARNGFTRVWFSVPAR